MYISKKILKRRILISVALSGFCLHLLQGQPLLRFEKIQVGDFRGESVAFGDLNNDGFSDVIAGGWWYQNPGVLGPKGNWKKNTLHNEYTLGINEQGSGYNSNDDFIHSIDVNHDGLDDVLGGSSQGKYFLNPGLNSVTGLWTGQLGIPREHEIHSGPLWDVDNDGITEEYLFSAGDGTPIRWTKYQGGAWKTFVLDNNGSNYGAGMGDVDGDGDQDIIRPGAWYERKGSGMVELDPTLPASWIRHNIAIGALLSDSLIVSGEFGGSPLHVGRNSVGVTGHVAQIYVYDVDGDGLNDLITTAAHRKGVFWYKQESDGRFTYKLIDSTTSQGHSTGFADLDNDGDPDLIVGKRYKAHFGAFPQDSDPLSDDPVTLNMYELTPGVAPYWHKKILAQDISSGTDLDIADIDNDGDLDITVTAKNAAGPWVLINQLVNQTDNPLVKTDLFTGLKSELENYWTPAGGEWTLSEGTILGRNPNVNEWGHLFSKQEYVNFSLRLKYRNVHGNSGVYIRAKEGGDFGAMGIQIDFGDMGGGKNSDGSVMTVTSNRWKWLPGNPIANPATTGAWHDMRIDVVGQSYKVFVDGKLTVRQKDVSHTLMPFKGKVAFQAHQGDNGEAYYKDVEIWVPKSEQTVHALRPSTPDHGMKIVFIQTKEEWLNWVGGEKDLEIKNMLGRPISRTSSFVPGIYFHKR